MGPFQKFQSRPCGNGNFGEGSACRIVADPGLDRVDLADPAIADELAGQAITGVGSLLAARLEDAVILPRGLDHRLAFFDGQAKGLLAVYVTAVLHRRDRGQGVPVIDRADRHRVEFLAGKQLAKIGILMTILTDHISGLLAVFRIDITDRHELDSGLALGPFHVAGALPADADGAHHDLVVGTAPARL